MNYIKALVTHKYFLAAVLFLFAVQAIFFAAVIKYGIPADERYHFSSIQYYSDSSIASGPLSSEQDPTTLPYVRNIEDSTSYFYHYLLSFPLRIVEQISSSQQLQIFILRLINVGLGVLTLYAFKRCLDEISDNTLLKNLSVLALSMTGMYIWLSSSINYDNLANLLFITFIWQGVKTCRRPSVVLWLTLSGIGFATVLTKYTFLPEILLGIIITGYFLLRKNGYTIRSYGQDLKKTFEDNKWTTAIAVSFSLVFALMFMQRAGMNLINYHQIQPTCTKIHTQEQCLTDPLFKRNFDLKQNYSPEEKHALANSLDPFGFTGSWVYSMYSTLYYYFGHQKIESSTKKEVSAAAVILMLGVSLILVRLKIRLNRAVLFVGILVITYIALLYMFNLRTLLNYGERIAFQGRYLLPILGFVYYFAGSTLINASRSLPVKWRSSYLYVCLAAISVAALMHFPPLLFYQGTDSSWYSGYFHYMK